MVWVDNVAALDVAWGASAAPEKVVASIEDFMADFVEGLLRGQLLNIELVREEDRER